jgi:hypothetical protein
MASHPELVLGESLGKRPVTVSCRQSQAKSQKETRSSSMESGHQEARLGAQYLWSIFSLLGTHGAWEISTFQEGWAKPHCANELR